MKSLLTLGLIFFAFSFCGLGDRLKQMSGGTSETNSNTASSSNSTAPGTSSSAAEKPKVTASQQAIMDGGTETKWDDQGLSWKLPASWKKMDVKKESFNYQSPDNAFLLVNISVMPDSFPMDTSLKAYHDQALQQLKNGKYESVRLIDIDGVTVPAAGSGDVFAAKLAAAARNHCQRRSPRHPHPPRPRHPCTQATGASRRSYTQ